MEVEDKIADELGEKIVKEIGFGDFGKVFLLESGKVLKLTSDVNEVVIAKKLIRNKNLFKYILNYYNVGEFDSNAERYFILMDYVEPLSNLSKVAINHVYKNLLQFSKSFYKSVFSPSLIDYINDQFSIRKIKDKYLLRQYNEKEIKQIKELALSFIPHIQNIAKELKLHHIEQCDFHGGNLGWDEDHTKLILFDISIPSTQISRQIVPKVKKYSISESLTSLVKKDDLGVIFARAKEVSEELGEEIVDYIGSGSYGFAFLTKSNKVFKLTSDKNEVYVAQKLSKYKNWMKCLINYYNVGKVVSSKPNFEADTFEWFILMDYIDLLNDDEKDAIDCYMMPMKYKSNYYQNILDKEEIMDHINFMYGEESSYDYQRLKLEYRSPEKVKQIAIDLYPKVLKIAKELKLHNIKETDFHSGNIGWDREHENLIFFDLGGGGLNKTPDLKDMRQININEKLITKFNRF